MSKHNPQSFDNIIDSIVKSNKLDRFHAELPATTDEERIVTITSILTSLKGVDGAKSEKTARDKLDDINNKISASSYQKKWSRLKPAQKIDRVKTYLKDIDFEEDELLEITDTLVSMITAGGLKSDKYVSYNAPEAKIESMIYITFNKKTKHYEFDKNTKVIPTKKLSIKKKKADSDDSSSDDNSSDEDEDDDDN